jgi:hypothetical protein
MQDRQRNGGGFSSSGLRDTDHVTIGHDDWNRLRMDRGRGQVFFLCECAQNSIVKSEVGEGGQRDDFLL